MDTHENILLKEIKTRKLTLKKELEKLCVELGFPKCLSKKFEKTVIDGVHTLALIQETKPQLNYRVKADRQMQTDECNICLNEHFNLIYC